MCFCGCDPVDAPAKVDPANGNLQLKTGPSNDAPGKMQFAQVNEPHPIFSAAATLSATVANATSVTAQLTLTDAAVNAGTPGTPYVVLTFCASWLATGIRAGFVSTLAAR